VSYSRGLIYALLSGVFLSSGGLMVRFLDGADPWTVLFYRSVAFFVTVMLFMMWRYRGKFVAQMAQLQAKDFLVSLFLALGFVFYLMSLYHTSVANTVLLLSTGPFFAAILGMLILGEAVLMLAYACMLVVLRSAKDNGGQARELLPATAIAGILAALFCVPLVDSFALDHSDLFISLCFGSVQIGAGFILITLAAQVVPAAQVALLALTETALAPLWVWLVFTETPGTHTLVGGMIIVAAVLYNGVVALRQSA